MDGRRRHVAPRVRSRPERAASFRPDIEGLRAVAVLLVVAGHVLGVPAGGYVGVDVFFVISGFLITGLLLREHARTGRIGLREFYARRARRLLPAAVLVLAVTNLAAYLLFAGERAGQVLRDSLWSLGFLANVRFAAIGTDYFDDTRPASPVQHYWSLSVEEQFYLVWPCLLLAALLVSRRRGPLVVLLGVTAASLTWSVLSTAADATAAYFSTPARAFELAVGALVAVAAHRGWLPHRPGFGTAFGWLGLYGIGLAALTLDGQTAFPGYAALLPVLATALVLVGGEAGAADRNPVLVNPVSRYLGRISYSLYLWHWPVLIVSLAVLPEPWHVAVPVVLSLGLAALSHTLVEEPVRRSSWLSRRPARSAPSRSGRRAAVALGAAAALLGGGFVLPALALHGGGLPAASAAAGPDRDETLAALQEEIGRSLDPPRWPPLEPPLEGITHAGAPEWIDDRCDNVNAGNLTRCRYGPPAPGRTAVLFGDSMAISWLPALRAVLEPRGVTVQVLTRNQCAAPQVMFFRQRPQEPYTQCADHKDWAVEQVRALRPDLVVVSSAITSLDKQVSQPQGSQRYAAWRDGMARTLGELAAAAGEVVVIGAPPRAGNVQECVTRLSEPGDCTERLPEQWLGVRDAERTAARLTGATYVDPEPWFCVDGRCPAVVGSTPVYTDGRHLTAAYARRLAPQLDRALGVILAGGREGASA